MKNPFRITVLAIVVTLVVSVEIFAQRPASEIVEYLRPTLDTQTVGILNVDLKRVRPSDLLDQFFSKDEQTIEAANLAQASTRIDAAIEALQNAGATELNFIYRIGTLIKENRTVVFHCDKNPRGVAELLKNDWQKVFGSHVVVQDNLVICGWNADSPVCLQAEWLKLHEAEELQSLTDALEESGDAPIRFAFALTNDQKRALDEIAPYTFMGGKNGEEPSITDLNFVTASFDAKGEFRFSINTTGAPAVKKFKSKLAEFVIALGKSPGIQGNTPKLSALIGDIPKRIATQGGTLSLTFCGGNFDDLIAAVSEPVRMRSRNALEKTKLLMIAEAIQKYEQANGHLPPAYSCDEEGNPLLSWRVLILPYFYGTDELSEQFKLDEPWDSPNNKPLSESVLWVYAAPDDSTQTRFLAITGDGALKESKDSKGHTISEITDGLSSTAAVVHVAPSAAVIWSKPNDLSVENEDLKSKLIIEGDRGFWAATCDGKAHYIPAASDVETLKKFMKANDGGVVELPGIGKSESEDRTEADIVDPNYQPQDELPEFWFKKLINDPSIISALG